MSSLPSPRLGAGVETFTPLEGSAALTATTGDAARLSLVSGTESSGGNVSTPEKLATALSLIETLTGNLTEAREEIGALRNQLQVAEMDRDEEQRCRAVECGLEAAAPAGWSRRWAGETYYWRKDAGDGLVIKMRFGICLVGGRRAWNWSVSAPGEAARLRGTGHLFALDAMDAADAWLRAQTGVGCG